MSELNVPMEVDESSDEAIKDIGFQWLKKFNSDILTEFDLINYWKDRVQQTIMSQESIKDRFEKEIITSMEDFICGGRKDINLKEQARPSSKCNRVFRVNEPTYSCDLCEVHKTSVLCKECFMQSSHRYHKYKMRASYGAGCCDCGNMEAWKQDAHCETHKLGLEKCNANTPFITKEMEARVCVVFRSILHYAYTFLTRTESLPFNSDLFAKVLEINCVKYDFCVILYYTDQPTFNQLLITLQCVSPHWHKQECIKNVSSFYRDGRVVVFRCSSYDECVRFTRSLIKYATFNGGPSIKTSILNYNDILNQICALKLLEWMESVMKYPEFRKVFSTVLSTYKISADFIIDDIFKKYTVMWRSARSHWCKLFISGMLIDCENKLTFAVAFTKNIEVIVDDFIADIYEYSISIFSLSVQLFTVPTIAKNLIVNHKILLKLFSILSKYFHQHLDENNKLVFQVGVKYPKFKNALFIVENIVHLLSCVPDTWTDDLRAPFLKAVTLFIDILNCMQHMSQNTRQVIEHQEYESEWTMTYNVIIKFLPLINKMLLWCASDKNVLLKVYEMVFNNIIKKSINLKKELRKLVGFQVYCFAYDVAKSPVSMHIPLHRFFTGLYLYFNNNQTIHNYSKWINPELFIEPVLQVFVLKSQVGGSMWKRNGNSLINQIYLYNTKCRSQMSDKDIIALQIGGSLINSNTFLIHVLNKFGLFHWVQRDFKCHPIDYSYDNEIPTVIYLAEEFLSLIITIVSARYNTFIGNVTLEDCIKQNVIQQLCLGPKSHSELLNSLSNVEGVHIFLDKSINEVADFKIIDGKHYFNLKPIYYDKYSEFYYYSRSDQSKSEDYQRSERKKAGKIQCCPPPCLPLFNDTFANVANLMQCNVILYIMKLILDRSVDPNVCIFGESELHRVLYLIGCALREEENQQNKMFKFTEYSKMYDIETTLDSLSRSPKVTSNKDLVTWTLNKFRQVSALRKNKNSVDTKNVSTEANERESMERNKANLAAARRKAAMAEIAELQKKFMKTNTEFLEEESNNSDVPQETRNANQKNIEENSISSIPLMTFDNKICILCQKQDLVTFDSQQMVLAAFVQNSSVLSQTDVDKRINGFKIFDEYCLSMDLCVSPHVSTCGHAMHLACYKNYFNRVLAKENKYSHRFKHALSFNVQKNEYLCPLCKGLCNIILPLLPPVSDYTKPKNTALLEKLSFEKWCEGINVLMKNCNVTPKGVKLLSVLHSHSPIPEKPKVNTKKVYNEKSVSQLVFVKPLDKIVAENKLKNPIQYFCIKNNFTFQILLFEKSTTIMNLKPVYTNYILSDEAVNLILQFNHNTFRKINEHTGITLAMLEQMPLTTWKSCAYTIRTNEMIFRYKNEPLFGDLCNRKNQCMESLVRTSVFLSTTWKRTSDINVLGIKFLSIVFNNGGNNPTEILNWDAFGMLVSLSMTLPSIYFNHESEGSLPRGNALDSYTFRLMFIAHIIQIILTFDVNKNPNVFEINNDSDTNFVAHLFYKLRGIIIKNTLETWNLIKNCSIPFLRCCSLFYHFLTGIPPPSVLKRINGDTYYNMCTYLGLPATCIELFNEPFVQTLIKNWSKSYMAMEIRAGRFTIFRDWMDINELKPLPDSYSLLMDNVLTFNCPNREIEGAKNPVMCLVCGKMLCSQCYCCQTEFNGTLVGACVSHTNTCGSGVGIFISLRDCEILLLTNNNTGSFMTAPFLDNWGENDLQMNRGYPLRLNNDRYRKLKLLWLEHELCREISKYLETTDTFRNYNWLHF